MSPLPGPPTQPVARAAASASEPPSPSVVEIVHATGMSPPRGRQWGGMVTAAALVSRSANPTCPSAVLVTEAIQYSLLWRDQAPGLGDRPAGRRDPHRGLRRRWATDWAPGVHSHRGGVATSPGQGQPTTTGSATGRCRAMGQRPQLGERPRWLGDRDCQRVCCHLYQLHRCPPHDRWRSAVDTAGNDCDTARTGAQPDQVR